MTDLKNVITTISPMKSSLLYLIEDISVVLPLLREHLIKIDTLDFSLNQCSSYDLVIVSNDQLLDIIRNKSTIQFSEDCTLVCFLGSSESGDSFENLLQPEGFDEISLITEDIKVYCKRLPEWSLVKKIAHFCYNHIEPGVDNDSQDGKLILKDGFGLCGSSSRAARYLAQSIGLEAKVATFRMEGLPFGRGEKKWDTHTICEVKLKTDDKWVVCDAMANICYPYSLNELISTPSLADQYLEQIGFVPDARWESRNYKWYSTSLAYSHAVSMKYPKVWYSDLKKNVQSLKRLLTK